MRKMNKEEGKIRHLIRYYIVNKCNNMYFIGHTIVIKLHNIYFSV